MTTYALLKSDTADWLERSDLTNTIPTLIRLCEAQIRRNLRVRAMETAADITITSGSGSLPSGFLEARRFTWDESNARNIDFVSPHDFYSSAEYDQSGTPSIYTIENSTVYVRPSATGTGKLLYFKAFDALSDDSDTNWALTNAYDLYLYGTLMNAAPYLKEDSRVAVWDAGYQRALAELNRSEDRARRSGPIRMRSQWAP